MKGVVVKQREVQGAGLTLLNSNWGFFIESVFKYEVLINPESDPKFLERHLSGF
jgi:hypothetical protein